MSFNLKGAVFNVARLSTVTQLLLFLPLTLSTLSTTAFLALSLFLFLHSVAHGTLLLILGPGVLSVLQVPVHPILLFVAFNIFSQPDGANFISTLAVYWGTFLKFITPFFIAIEAISSLLVAQTLGQEGKRLAGKSEAWQLGLLICSAAAYVCGGYWIIKSYPAAAVSPFISSLLGCILTNFLWLTRFNLRRTNVVESSVLFLYLAFNMWLSTFDRGLSEELPIINYLPLIDNIMPHLHSLMHFLTNTFPKPILVSLAYRLTVMHLSSRILPAIGADAWERGSGIDIDEERPINKIIQILLTYRQAIFVTAYTHLLYLEPSAQVWWRHVTVLICLLVWAIEILIAGEDDDEFGSEVKAKGWKMD